MLVDDPTAPQPIESPPPGSEPCAACGGSGEITTSGNNATFCRACRGVGYFGLPTDGRPGSDLKVSVLAARELAGVPLFDDRDAPTAGRGSSLE